MMVEAATINEFADSSPSVLPSAFSGFASRPDIPGRRTAPFPKHEEAQLFARGRRDFQRDAAGVRNDLGGDVDDPPPRGGGVANRLEHRRTDVLLEGLVEEKGDEHGVVKGRVGSKSLERELLEREVLEGPVHQFVGSPSMIRGDDLLGGGQVDAARLCQCVIDGVAQPQVGVQERVGSGKGEQHLAVLIEGPAEDGPAEALPALAAAAKLQVLPDLTALLVAGPRVDFCPVYVVLRLINPAPADVADAELLERIEELLIEKAASMRTMIGTSRRYCLRILATTCRTIFSTVSPWLQWASPRRKTASIT